MYFGSTSDLLFKDKNWLMKQPKFDVKESNVNYIQMGGKTYKLNLLDGSLTLCEKTLNNFLRTTNKKKSLNKALIKRKDTISNLNNPFKDINSFTASRNKRASNVSSLKTLSNLNQNNNENDSDNYKFKQINLKKSKHANNYYLTERSNKTKKKFNSTANKIFKRKLIKLDTTCLEKSLKSLKKFYSHQKKNNSKIKNFTVFGHKFLKPQPIILTEKEKREKYFEKADNCFNLLYKQHLYNLSGERINEKIYYPTENDTELIKTYKDEMLKENIISKLKTQFQFYKESCKNKNNKELNNIPNILHKNYVYYKGYSFCDKNNDKRLMAQKMFFNNINRNKKIEKERIIELFKIHNNK